MDTYGILIVIAIAASVGAVFSVISYCIAVWLVSRETHIEQITIDPKRTHKFPKIDISVAYKGAKVGHVLSGRK